MIHSLLMMLAACQHNAPTMPQAAVASPSSSAQSWIRERWNLARADEQWMPPPPMVQSQIATTIEQLYKASPSCDTSVFKHAQAELSKYGLMVEDYSTSKHDLWLVYEPQEGKGLGVTAIRCGEAAELVLQAPHAIHDKWTGAIVRNIFVEHPVRMAMWNSTHRYRSRPEESQDSPEHPADVAHNRDSVFHQQVVLLSNHSQLRFVQLHGFALTDDWDIILSFGTAQKQATLLGQTLQGLSSRVGLFGKDVDILGATTNVQAQTLNQASVGRFVHIELGIELREQLKEDAQKRSILYEGLIQPW